MVASVTVLCHIRRVPPSPPCPTNPGDLDGIFQAFLAARTQEEADQQLVRLLALSTPLITRCLDRRGRDENRSEADDAASEARTQLTLHLHRLRTEARGRSIDDFGAYVFAVARAARAQSIRRRHPARAMLLNRLRYLLEGRARQSGFALWKGPGQENWAGFEAWREQPLFTGVAGSHDKRDRLLANPAGVAVEIFGPGDGQIALPLPDLVARVFAWLGEPLRLRDLVDAVAHWQNVHPGRGEALVTDDGEGDTAGLPDNRQPSPHDALRWKEYLLWLLRETTRLPLRQRTAFLLHSPCLRELELLGLTGVRQSAALLEIPPAQLAQYWTRLPLEDRVIGILLGLDSQRVVNLRKAARIVLGQAWQRFLDGD